LNLRKSPRLAGFSHRFRTRDALEAPLSPPARGRFSLRRLFVVRNGMLLVLAKSMRFCSLKIASPSELETLRRRRAKGAARAVVEAVAKIRVATCDHA